MSVPVTGRAEPWDADSPYYVVALATAGAISGAVLPKHLWAHYIGAVLGQAAYELIFLRVGPLFVLGLAFLAAYSVIFVAVAAIVAYLRRSKDEATAV